MSAQLGEELEPDSAAFPFAVSPPLGQLPPGEASDFVVTYRPSSSNLDSFAAVLQPLDLPPEAMPGYSADDDETAEPALEVGLRLGGRGLRCSSPVAGTVLSNSSERRLAVGGQRLRCSGPVAGTVLSNSLERRLAAGVGAN